MTNSFSENFWVDSWSFNQHSGELTLYYQLESSLRLKEIFYFGSVDINRYCQHKKIIDKAFQLLHWMAGVSYYKTGLSRNVRFKESRPNRIVADWVKRTWSHGLAELAYNYNMSLQQHFTVEFSDEKWMADRLQLRKRSLVAIGGGKDSLVSIELLKQMNEPLSLFMVGNSDFIKSVAEATEVPLIFVPRQLDPMLSELNTQGAYNGHIPITAINNCVGLILALLHDYDCVVFSNEYSANYANTIDCAGTPVNHQYSKSFEYEKLWNDLIQKNVCSDVHVFSLLRPYSELRIMQQFSHLTQYFSIFSSCNRNFHLTGTQNIGGHWCGNCPKCHFVFLGLAPFIGRESTLEIFSDNYLDKLENEESYRELLGLKGIKPFECVGDVDESRLALQWLAADPAWHDSLLVKKLSCELSYISDSDVAQTMSFHHEHLIPQRFLAYLPEKH